MVVGEAMSNKFQSKQALKWCFNWTVVKKVVFSLIFNAEVHMKFYRSDQQGG